MKEVRIWIIAFFIQCIALPLFAADINHSGKSDISDDPFLAYGYNPKTKVISGYLAALRTAPGRTDECKLAFVGNPKSSSGLSVKYMEADWLGKRSGQPVSRVSIVEDKHEFRLKFSRESLGGDCDWILPFNAGPSVSETPDEVSVTMNVSNTGDWIGVYVISAKRAKFHSRPTSDSVRKAYLVEGDVIFVYEEQPDWYFVEYEEEKRKTVGWIRKADTVQP
jgi:hypothetical protein